MMQTYTLKMSGLTLEEAKELAENGSTFMWAKEGDDIVAYPSSHEHPAVISKEKEIWSATSPQEQGLYWHWSGSVDDAPIVLSVLYSGSKKECFVSIGQYGITKAIFCSEYGGFWASCPQPELPIH